MCSDQTVMTIRTFHQIMTCLDSVSTSTRRVQDHSAQLVTGLPSTGLEDLRMAELLLTPNRKVTKDQRPSPYVTIKFSNAGILLLPNSIKEILLLLIAHHSMPMVMLTPGHQLAENQSHSILISTSRLRFLSAEELQSSSNNLHNQ